jgi:hypothetical protein
MGIGPTLDEPIYRPANLFLRAEPMTAQELTFQGGEEALAKGIIVSVPDRTHRRAAPYFPAAFAEGERGV